MNQMTENGSESDEQKNHSNDFMIEQYRSLSDLFWRNEELGERRVNFLIGLVTAVTAALVALADVENLDYEAFFPIAILALTALLSLGIVTWLRMMHRNRVTDDYKRAMDIVREWFEFDDKSLKGYRPFPESLLFTLDYARFSAELSGISGWVDCPEDLREAFQENGTHLGERPKIRAKCVGRRWLVKREDESRSWRKRRYLITKSNNKLAVFKPRNPSGGGLTEMVSVMNGVFAGAMVVLIVLGLEVRVRSTADASSIDSFVLVLALISGLFGIVGAITIQYLWMMNYYEQYDIFVPQGDSPPDDNNTSPPTGN